MDIEPSAYMLYLLYRDNKSIPNDILEYLALKAKEEYDNTLHALEIMYTYLLKYKYVEEYHSDDKVHEVYIEMPMYVHQNALAYPHIVSHLNNANELNNTLFLKVYFFEYNISLALLYILYNFK